MLGISLLCIPQAGGRYATHDERGVCDPDDGAPFEAPSRRNSADLRHLQKVGEWEGGFP